MGKNSRKGKGPSMFVQAVGSSDKLFWRPLVRLLNCYSYKPIFSIGEMAMKII